MQGRVRNGTVCTIRIARSQAPELCEAKLAEKMRGQRVPSPRFSTAIQKVNGGVRMRSARGRSLPPARALVQACPQQPAERCTTACVHKRARMAASFCLKNLVSELRSRGCWM